MLIKTLSIYLRLWLHIFLTLLDGTIHKKKKLFPTKYTNYTHFQKIVLHQSQSYTTHLILISYAILNFTRAVARSVNTLRK